MRINKKAYLITDSPIELILWLLLFGIIGYFIWGQFNPQAASFLEKMRWW